MVDHLAQRDASCAEDLPIAGHPRRQRQAAPVPALDAPILVEHERTRADEAHLTAQHVEELRELVERSLAEQTAQPR